MWLELDFLVLVMMFLRTSSAFGLIGHRGMCMRLSCSTGMAPIFEGKRVLTVGDGSMGFSAALSRSAICESVTASTWDSEESLMSSYDDARRNLEVIAASSNQVVYGVDAIKLDSNLGLYDLVVWNFPHVPGKANTKHNRALIDGFLQASDNVLTADGKVLLTLCPDQSGWHAATHTDFLASWKLSHYAAQNGYLVTQRLPFEATIQEEFSDLYYPVGHRGSGGKFSAFRGRADVFILSRSGDAHQAPLYSHELHVTSPSIPDMKWLERQVRSAVEDAQGMVVWSCQVVDLYVCPRTKLVTTAIEVAYCSITRALGRDAADAIRLETEKEIAGYLNNNRHRHHHHHCHNDHNEAGKSSALFALRQEKIGGRVSQPHCWGVALRKRKMEEDDEGFTEGLYGALRSLEQDGQDGQEGAMQTLELLNEDNLTKTESCRGGDQDIETIRSMARGLWRRRLGVLIKEVGYDEEDEDEDDDEDEGDDEAEGDGEGDGEDGIPGGEWSLYLLKHALSGRTYLGVTINMERRLRQHNGLLSGGAKYTRAFLGTHAGAGAGAGAGEEDGGYTPWKQAVVVSGLTRSRALSLEAQIKASSKKMNISTMGKARTSDAPGLRAVSRAQLVLRTVCAEERRRATVSIELDVD